MARETQVELEAFVHGALCISYSGQCLASLSLGGRSADRGRCDQPCRLPYELVREDDDDEDLDAARPFMLSPHDLAAYDRLPGLVAAGVAALKIEGRLKPPEYVAVVTRFYRAALDALPGKSDLPAGDGKRQQSPLSLREMANNSPLSLRERARVRAMDSQLARRFSETHCPHPPLSPKGEGEKAEVPSRKGRGESASVPWHDARISPTWR